MADKLACNGHHPGDALWLDVHSSNNLGYVFQPDCVEQCMVDGSPINPLLELRTRRNDILGVLEGPTCWGGACGGPTFEYRSDPSSPVLRASVTHLAASHWARGRGACCMVPG